MATRDYTSGTTAALFSLSQRTCYYPRCNQPVVVIVEGSPTVNLEIAHIVGLNDGSARAIDPMSIEERNQFSNLILLCHAHHKRVDSKRTRDEYGKDLLLSWKSQVEQGGQDVLASYTMTDEKLDDLITGAMDRRLIEVRTALLEVRETNAVAATAIEQLAGRFNDYQLIGNYVDADQASMLSEAARQLRAVLDPDLVSDLQSAAADLAIVKNGELAEHVKEAASELTAAVRAFIAARD